MHPVCYQQTAHWPEPLTLKHHVLRVHWPQMEGYVLSTHKPEETHTTIQLAASWHCAVNEHAIAETKYNSFSLSSPSPSSVCTFCGDFHCTKHLHNHSANSLIAKEQRDVQHQWDGLIQAHNCVCCQLLQAQSMQMFSDQLHDCDRRRNQPTESKRGPVSRSTVLGLPFLEIEIQIRKVDSDKFATDWVRF